MHPAFFAISRLAATAAQPAETDETEKKNGFLNARESFDGHGKFLKISSKPARLLPGLAWQEAYGRQTNSSA